MGESPATNDSAWTHWLDRSGAGKAERRGVNGSTRRRIAQEGIDDWDKPALFSVGVDPRRSTSSLDTL
jgi:hypothetical protein